MTWRMRGFALLAVAGLATGAMADVVDINITGALDDPSLNLPDGQWIEDRDWGWGPGTPNTLGWVIEDWVGADPVDLNVNIILDEGPGGTDVSINKSLSNNTGFEWTSFLIELTPALGSGPIVIADSSVASSVFADHTTTNNVDGSASILFFDGSVGVGNSVNFFFTFNIPGSVSFQMVQTPIPAPGAMALLGFGALAAVRRRR